MNFIKTTLVGVALFSLLSFSNARDSRALNTDVGLDSQSEGIQRGAVQYDNRYNPGPNSGVAYPGYSYPGYAYPGQYLYPESIDPGQDEADAIFRANAHPGE